MFWKVILLQERSLGKNQAGLRNKQGSQSQRGKRWKHRQGDYYCSKPRRGGSGGTPNRQNSHFRATENKVTYQTLRSDSF